MKITKKEIVLTIALSLAPMLLGIFFWNELPDQVPTHFSLSGEADGWSSRAFAVFGIPGIMAAIELLVAVALSTDPKRSNQPKIMQRLGMWTIPIVSWVVVPISILAGLGRATPIGLILQLLLGILFIAVGNYLPKCRPNYTVGIRVPWTLHDDDNWNYTHRIGGFCFVGGGAAFLLNAFISWEGMVFIVPIAVGVIPILASYLYERRHGARNDGSDE